MDDIPAGEKAPSCGAQNRKAKSLKVKLVYQIAKLVRKAGLSYGDWRYVARHVRRLCTTNP